MSIHWISLGFNKVNGQYDAYRHEKIKFSWQKTVGTTRICIFELDDVISFEQDTRDRRLPIIIEGIFVEGGMVKHERFYERTLPSPKLVEGSVPKYPVGEQPVDYRVTRVGLLLPPSNHISFFGMATPWGILWRGIRHHDGILEMLKLGR